MRVRRAQATTTACETKIGAISAEIFFVDLVDVTLFAQRKHFEFKGV
jgi:hypothetical protein